MSPRSYRLEELYEQNISAPPQTAPQPTSGNDNARFKRTLHDTQGYLLYLQNNFPDQIAAEGGMIAVIEELFEDLRKRNMLVALDSGDTKEPEPDMENDELSDDDIEAEVDAYENPGKDKQSPQRGRNPFE